MLSNPGGWVGGLGGSAQPCMGHWLRTPTMRLAGCPLTAAGPAVMLGLQAALNDKLSDGNVYQMHTLHTWRGSGGCGSANSTAWTLGIRLFQNLVVQRLPLLDT